MEGKKKGRDARLGQHRSKTGKNRQNMKQGRGRGWGRGEGEFLCIHADVPEVGKEVVFREK